ncbi:hypothetical protein Hanom_Chr07g00612271 [Helianthus anomalus]
MKMARFQTLWIQMRKNKPLDESRKTGQTSGTKMTFYSNSNNRPMVNDKNVFYPQQRNTVVVCYLFQNLGPK